MCFRLQGERGAFILSDRLEKANLNHCPSLSEVRTRGNGFGFGFSKLVFCSIYNYTPSSEPLWSSGHSYGCRSRSPGSIPGSSRFSEKYWVWNGVHSASWVQLRSYLKEKVVAQIYKTENTAVGIHHADHETPYIQKKLALTSPTSSSCSVGIVRWLSEITECNFFSSI
jgi:hypothetical protein